MSYQLIIEEKAGYLNVFVAGENNPETVNAYFRQVRQLCMARGMRRVLIEQHLEGTLLMPLDASEIASKAALEALGHVEVMAFVDPHAGKEAMERFASNWGVRAMAFQNVQDARDWIEKQP